ncbi:MAG: glucokinase [Candidatus Competibacteraceae bacterium]
MQEFPTGPHDLIADISGTNARFARIDAHRRIYAEQIFSCADFTSLTAAATAYLQATGAAPDAGRPSRSPRRSPATGSIHQQPLIVFSTETAQRGQGWNSC